MTTLTNREYFRLYGFLTLERIEALIELEEDRDAEAGTAAYLEEARSCFPEEDFLDRAIALAKGKLKTTLEEIAQSVGQSADYGRECLDKALEEFPS